MRAKNAACYHTEHSFSISVRPNIGAETLLHTHCPIWQIEQRQEQDFVVREVVCVCVYCFFFALADYSLDPDFLSGSGAHCPMQNLPPIEPCSSSAFLGSDENLHTVQNSQMHVMERCVIKQGFFSLSLSCRLLLLLSSHFLNAVRTFLGFLRSCFLQLFIQH